MTYARIQSNLSAIDVDAHAMSDQVNALTTEVAQAKADLLNAQAALATEVSRVAARDATISQLQAQIVVLQARIVELESLIPPPTMPLVTVARAPASVLEDGTANLVYTFTRSGSTSAPLTVNYTVGGTATIGSDYTGISTAGTIKTVSFAAGSATAVVTVDPTADATVEADETVVVTVAAGSGYTIDASGSATGTITNDDTATALSLIPTFFNHPSFANSVNVAGQVYVGPNTTVVDRTANASGSAAGNPMVFMGGNNAKVLRVRGIGREGIRIGEAGSMEMDGCFIEVAGQGTDHADALQCYGPGVASNTITLRNSFLYCKQGAPGTANCAYFAANNYMGNHVIENCVLAGGGYTLRIPGDGGTSISMKDVYFLDGTWGYAPILFDFYNNRNVTIVRWENVRRCTIVNNVIIPGALIARPY
jgi:hypothetical protein